MGAEWLRPTRIQDSSSSHVGWCYHFCCLLQIDTSTKVDLYGTHNIIILHQIRLLMRPCMYQVQYDIVIPIRVLRARSRALAT